jgi:hypothetical protein
LLMIRKFWVRDRGQNTIQTAFQLSMEPNYA